MNRSDKPTIYWDHVEEVNLEDSLAAVRARFQIQQQLNDDLTGQGKLTGEKLILTMNTRHFVVVGVL